MNSNQIIELIKRQSGAITGAIVKHLIDENELKRDKVLRLFKAYEGEVPILKRNFNNPDKINNKLPNDYRGDIVDQITGYLFGNPINYTIDKSTAKIIDELDSFQKRNNIDDLDSQTGQNMAICGYAARLCYIDPEGKEKVMNINPWEVIFVQDASIDEIQYALIYYDVDIIHNSGKPVKRTRAEFYDKKNITYFISNEKNEFDLDYIMSNGRNPQPHLFDYVPVIRYKNNESMQGDFEKVDGLIDGFDRIISDVQNEIEEFRLAYFIFYGAEPTAETIEDAKRSGAFYFPEGADGKFLTKELGGIVQFLENHKKTLNDNIYKFSKTVDMRDDQFSGSAMSGESRKWKLVTLENKAITKERKFTRASREMFKVIFSAWKKKGLNVNYEDVEMQFSRNLPVDLLYSADATMKLKGMISDETRLGLLPFIKDVPAELEKLNNESNAAIEALLNEN